MTIRILQCGMTDNLGGIETFLFNYYSNIDRNEIQFDFINIYDNDLCFSDNIKKYGGRVYKLKSYYQNPYIFIKQMVNIIIKNKYDVVHCHMNSAVMLWPLIAAKIAGCKVIIAHAHNSSSDKGILKTILHGINKRFIPLFANCFFACSNTAGEWFFSKKIRNSNSYKLIYNSVDFSKFKFNKKIREKVRKEFNISENTVVIGHVGRFNKQKNHDFLIDLFNIYQHKNQNCMLVLVGVGPLYEEILRKSEKLKIKSKILFLGNRNDVNEIMCAMDIFVLPSLYEGLPLVGVEAQVNGLPTIFSDSITREVELSKATKFISLKCDLIEWNCQIENLLNSSDKCHEDNLLHDKIKNFEINNSAIRLQNIYKDWRNN